VKPNYPPCAGTAKALRSDAGIAHPRYHWVTESLSDKLIDAIPYLLVHVYRHMATRACFLAASGTEKSQALVDAAGLWKQGWVLSVLDDIRRIIIPRATDFGQARFDGIIYDRVEAKYLDILIGASPDSDGGDDVGGDDGEQVGDQVNI